MGLPAKADGILACVGADMAGATAVAGLAGNAAVVSGMAVGTGSHVSMKTGF